MTSAHLQVLLDAASPSYLFADAATHHRDHPSQDREHHDAPERGGVKAGGLRHAAIIVPCTGRDNPNAPRAKRQVRARARPRPRDRSCHRGSAAVREGGGPSSGHP